MPTIAVRFIGDSKLDLTELGDHIISFGQSSQMSTHKILIDQDLDKYAKQLHEVYAKKYNDTRKWEKLDNFTKDSNCLAIDHFRVVKKRDTRKKSIQYVRIRKRNIG